MNDILEFEAAIPLEAEGGGIVISRGTGRHIERVAAHFTLLYVLQGVLYIEEDGREFVVQAGQTLLLWPKRLHRGTRDYAPNLQFFWLHFTLEPFASTPLTLATLQPFAPPPLKPESQQQSESLLHIPQHKKLARPEFVTELFRRLLDDQGSGLAQPLSLVLYAWMILLEVARDSSLEDGAQAALARRVNTYIRTHHHERISVADIARAIGYNSHYLARIYRRTYNCSLASALRRMRINHAKFLLLETNQTITNISQLTGFEDASYFQRVFKELEGITPTQFRRLHAHMNVNY